MEKDYRTVGDLTRVLNDSNTSLSEIGADAELQVLLEDEQGREVARYWVARFLPTSRGNLVMVVDL